MSRPFKLVAIEPQPDGSVDVITKKLAKAMNLPFNSGWHHWEVHQNGERVFYSKTYGEAYRTWSALNSAFYYQGSTNEAQPLYA